MELIGLEAEAASELAWQVAAVPGLLQTEEYARAIHAAHQQVVLEPPGVFERRVAARMIRQQVLTTRNPPLELSAVIDEAVLLRKVGSREVMFEQLRHLAEMAELPNVELRVLPLQSETSLRADSFVVFGFSRSMRRASSATSSAPKVSTDTFTSKERPIHMRSASFFDAFVAASLSPEASRELILETAQQHW